MELCWQRVASALADGTEMVVLMEISFRELKYGGAEGRNPSPHPGRFGTNRGETIEGMGVAENESAKE